MIIKHEANTLVSLLSNAQILETFADTYSLLNTMLVAKDEIELFNAGEVDEDELLDVLDECNSFNFKALDNFKGAFSSMDVAVNKYFSRTLVTAKFALDSCRQVSKLGSVACQAYKDYCANLQRSIAGFSNFLVNEFGISLLLEVAAKGGTELPIDEIVKMYTDANGISVTQLAERINKIAEDNKMKLDIFDEYPELELEFEKVMGPFVNLVDGSNLTIELVNDAIAGKYTPEEVAKITSDEGEELSDDMSEISCF